MALKWEPFLDNGGNLYFYNHLTGESVWELPPDTAEDQDDQSPALTTCGGSNTHKSLADPGGDGGVDAKAYSQYSMAVGVVETVVKLVDAVDDSDRDASPGKAATMEKKKDKKKMFMSPAAESRRRKNDAKVQKRKQRRHDISAEKYMKLVLPPVSLSTGIMQGNELEGDAKLRRTDSLFTTQDSVQWQRELEAERVKERRAGRKQRQEHKLRVRSLKRQQIMLLQLRTELVKHLLGDIQCSPELLKQKILLLSSQTPQAVLATSRLEPETAEKLAAAERQAKDERLSAIQATFEMMDAAKCGKIRLVSVITGIFAHEAQVQQYCAVVKGLGELLASPRLQQFIVNFASSRQNDCEVTALEFREFVSIIEEAWDYYTRIKSAVHDAENEIDAAIEAAAFRPGTGVMRARMGFVSKKKAEHELAQLQERAALLRSMTSDASEGMPWLQGDSLIQPKQEWEKGHHHRFIQASQGEDLYCCLCRRRQWELARNEADDAEQNYRDEWPTLLELRLKEAEVRMVSGISSIDEQTETTDGVGSPPASPMSFPTKEAQDATTGEQDFVSYKLMTLTDDNEIAVVEVLHTLLVVIESMTSEQNDEEGKKRSVHHRVHRRRKRKTTKDSVLHRADPTTGLSPMQIIENAFHAEESTRRALFEEERAMRIELERYKRRLERPALRFQEAANDNYVCILERCVNLPPLLSNLRFERCLSLPSSQKMVLLMVDNASPDVSTSVVLYKLPHRNESEANYSFGQLKLLQQRLRSPFVASMRLVDKRSFQNFAGSGMLVECWPMQFVATEFFPRGSWLEFYRQWILERQQGDANAYAQVEQHVLTVFRDVAAGVSAMHSLGVLHLNIKADNIYVCSDDSDAENCTMLPKHVKVKIGGLLAWKAGYDSEGLAQGNVLECMHFNYAPPEALDRRPISPKADVWMVGCAICDALLLWQHVQLAAATSNPSAKYSSVVFSSRSVHDLLLMLPLATSAAVRSLIRMLLQSEPASRPDMSQVAEYISFAGVNQAATR